MRYWFCLTCKRKTTTLLNEQLLRCKCGEYEKHMIIETDSIGNPVKKEVIE